MKQIKDKVKSGISDISVGKRGIAVSTVQFR